MPMTFTTQGPLVHTSRYTGRPSFLDLALFQVTRAEDGNGLELELYPVHFTMYKHTNYPPQSPKSMIHQVWSVMCTAIGIGGDGGKSNTDRLPEGVAQPAPPSRVAYYRAAFSRNATMKEVMYTYTGPHVCSRRLTVSSYVPIPDFCHFGRPPQSETGRAETS